MRPDLPRCAEDQGRVLRAAPRRLPRAHPVPRRPHHAHQARGERLRARVRLAESGAEHYDLASVRRVIRAALRPLRLPRESEVALAFVDDAQMRELNRRHRRIDRTTDVLSFGQRLPRGVRGAEARSPLDEDPDGVLRLGDILISPAQARRQAKRRRRPLESEVAFLAAHGALHLVGYEDETPAGYREMLRLGHDATRQNSVNPGNTARGT